MKPNPFGESISNRRLTLTDLPSPRARWKAIERFALTYYGYTNSFETSAAIANAQRDRTLLELRTCLFFEQRRWRHFGMTPDRAAMAYIRGIMEKIRRKLQKKSGASRSLSRARRASRSVAGSRARAAVGVAKKSH